MGMDVFGLKPKTEKGEYFRNNVWFWHPLWDYCCYIDNSLIEKVPNAHDNSGDGLGPVDSRKLGFKLLKSIETGDAESYVNLYYKNLESLEQQPCVCTIATNTSTTLEALLQSAINNISTSYDKYGDIPFPKQKSESKPDCTLCNGSGLVENYSKNYHINLENIESFAKFLIDCGGFQIC